MARMIPGSLRRVRASRGEGHPRRFEMQLGLEHWTVLHSLGIAQHERQVEGEADFVIVAPDAGLLVIEVKSHLSVAVARMAPGASARTLRQCEDPFSRHRRRCTASGTIS